MGTAAIARTARRGGICARRAPRAWRRVRGKGASWGALGRGYLLSGVVSCLQNDTKFFENRAPPRAAYWRSRVPW